MADEETIEKARWIIITARDRLDEFERIAKRHRDYHWAMQRFRQWMNLTCNFLAEYVSQIQAEKLRSYQPPSGSRYLEPKQVVSLVDECRAVLMALEVQLHHYPDQVLNVPVAKEAIARAVGSPSDHGFGEQPIADEEKIQKARALITDVLNELADIVPRAKADGDFAAARERLNSWKSRTVRLLAESVSQTQAKRLKGKELHTVARGGSLIDLVNETEMYRGFLVSLCEDLERHPNDVLDMSSPRGAIAPGGEPPSPIEPGTVFIIHGHDKANRFLLEKLLRGAMAP